MSPTTMQKIVSLGICHLSLTPKLLPAWEIVAVHESAVCHVEGTCLVCTCECDYSIHFTFPQKEATTTENFFAKMT